MIYAFTGLGGSGKTYTMIHKWAFWYWKHGVKIYSNTRLLFSKYSMEDQRVGINIIDHPKDFSILERIFEKIYYFIQVDLRRKKYIPKHRGKIIYFDTIEEIQTAKDGIILFDEGQVLFSSAAWKEISDEFKYKVSQERKHDLDFFTTTRRFRSILIDYRQEVHRWFYCQEILAIKYGKRNRKKILFGLYQICEKDMECYNEQIPDRQNETLKRRFFFITKWSKKLYDTKYDIGFTPLKLIYVNNSKICQKAFLILPRRMSLKDGLNAMSMTSRLFLQKK